MTQLLPPKKEVALALLERSNVDVHLDPRAKGVVVPPQFRKEPRLILKIGLNMPVPIPDLRLDEESMSCTLSFNRSPFFCVVPWPSVFAMVGEDGRGMMWPDDVPKELHVRVIEEEGRGRGDDSPSSEASATLAPVSSSKSGGKARARIVSARDSDEPVSDREGGKSKRSKKKKDERPVLMAVPSPPRSSPGDEGARARSKDESRKDESRPLLDRSERADKAEKADKGDKRDKDEKRPAASPARGVPLPVPAPKAPAPNRGAGGPNRPKRELPPYLRVVK